jgi:uncharacterized protein YbbC (DUF1343 family)
MFPRKLIFFRSFGTVIFCTLLFSQCLAQYLPKIQLGIDRLVMNPPKEIIGKKLGLITNPTGIGNNLRSTIDVLFTDNRFELTALFGPEHGVRGDVFAGKKIVDYKDSKTGVPVYSLYGKTRKPTKEMLKDVDVLVFDIQDIGIRPYTYIYTMAYGMEAAKEKNIPFIVLDRPNPLGGKLIEGPVLNPKFKSFIGLYPIPYVPGMTVGELALLFNKEYEINCNLIVVPMNGWKREMLFDETGLIWVPTSPHLPHPETSFYFAATGGFGELGTISEGVGTPFPFEICGGPWVDGTKLAEELNQFNLPGIYFRSLTFKTYYLRFVDESCSGVQLHITDFSEFQPMRTQIHLMTSLKKLFPEYDYFEKANRRISSFNRALGTDEVMNAIQEGKSADEIIASWQGDLEEFKKIREKYLLYN